MHSGSVIKDKRTGNLGIIISVWNANVLGMESLPIFSVIWKGVEMIEDVYGEQLLNQRYEFIRMCENPS